ncbi:MAG: tetratricopeptide repeat protein [Pirellulaceae bacterium]
MRYLKKLIPAAACVAVFVLTLSAMETSICYAQRGGRGGGASHGGGGGGGSGRSHGGGSFRGGGAGGGGFAHGNGSMRGGGSSRGGGSMRGGGSSRGGSPPGGGSHAGSGGRGGGSSHAGGSHQGGGFGGGSGHAGGSQHGNSGGHAGHVGGSGRGGSGWSNSGRGNSGWSDSGWGNSGSGRGGSSYSNRRGGYYNSYNFGRSPYYSGYGSRSGYYGGYNNGGFGLSIVAPLLRYGSLFNSLPYYSGYGGYGSNYYGGAYYNRAPSVASTQTYRVPTSSSSGPLIPTSAGAAAYQLQAERAFREHRYEDAAKYNNHAVVEDGENGRLYLFASQTLFALGDYQGAASAIHQAASLLDRSEWGYVVQNYAQFYRGRDYVTQMEQLVDFIDENPDASYAYFLRGYHYVYLGHDDAARKQLTKAVELESRDQLAAELLVQVGGTVPESARAPQAEEEIGDLPPPITPPTVDTQP